MRGPRDGQVVKARADLFEATSSRYWPGGLSSEADVLSSYILTF